MLVECCVHSVAQAEPIPTASLRFCHPIKPIQFNRIVLVSILKCDILTTANWMCNECGSHCSCSERRKEVKNKKVGHNS